MKLLALPGSPFSRKVRVVLAEKKIECELQTVDLQAVPHPVIGHNPLGTVPTLVLDDGSALYDSRVIVDFLDGVSPISRLIPEGTRDRVAVRRWEALADGVCDAGVLIRQEAKRPANAQHLEGLDRQLQRMKRGMLQLEAELGERAWCHGDRYSLADIAVGCCIGWLDYRKIGGVEWLAEYPALARHYAKLMERAAFADTAPQ